MLAARLSECYWWEKPAANENVRRRNHLFESDTAGATTAEYIWLGNQRLAKAEGNNLYFMHTDHLGTVQLLTNNTGAVVWSGDYKPFGDVTETVTTVTNNLRFPGQMFDEETGLHYNYFRDYDPGIGRYIESDPIGLGIIENIIRLGVVGYNPDSDSVVYNIDKKLNHVYVYGFSTPLNNFDYYGLRPTPGSGSANMRCRSNCFGTYFIAIGSGAAIGYGYGKYATPVGGAIAAVGGSLGRAFNVTALLSCIKSCDDDDCP